MNGFAIIIKLFQKIYSNGYFITWTEDDQLLFAKKINSEITLVNSVINTAIKREIFNKSMYEKYGILTSKGIQRRYFEICRQLKRKAIEINKKYLLIVPENNQNNQENENSEEIGVKEGEVQEETDINSEETGINSEFSTQKKGKEMKGKEMKSIYLSCPDEKTISATKTEIQHYNDMMDEIDKSVFYEIVNKSGVKLYDENLANEIITIMQEIYLNPDTKEKIKKIKLEHIDYAIRNFSKANTEGKIQMPKKYFKKCLLNALDETELSKLFNINFDGG